MALGESVQLGREDDRVAVAVGVEQPDPARRRRQRGLDQREHRRDAAARGERHDVVITGREDEDARRAGGLDLCARHQHVDHPVGHDPAGHTLHGDLQLGVDLGRRRHRVAPKVRHAVDHDAEGQELAGLVVVSLMQRGRHLEHERSRLGGLAHDSLDPERVEAVIAGNTRLRSRWRRDRHAWLR